jgi:glycosyltransferase involved in cell wall biosynthesis
VDWRRSCAIVIPCLNEARHVGDVVRQTIGYLPRVIVVDDGSTDGTAGRAELAGAKVLRHSTNRGKGVALTSGLSAALEEGYSWALTMDGDGQHASSDIPNFLKCAEATAATLVIGNRMQRPVGMPLVRRLVNRWMSRCISVRTGHVLPDTQCGFRLVDLRVWSELALTAERFEAESEILFRFLQARQRVEFVPIQVIYGNERSKINPAADTIRWFRWWRGIRRREQARLC